MRLILRVADTGAATLSAAPDIGYSGGVPPINEGPRVTHTLSSSAARELSGAAYKAHMNGTPLRAMWVLTCRPEARERVQAGTVVLSSEVRRFLTAVRARVNRRGYPAFVYIWVAENPDDDCPHVHLLTSLDIPRSEFAEWAQWAESVWGHGFVHMERLRQPEKAGAYLLKACGYIGKGKNGSQGTVVGSRYGISTSIRVKRDSYDVASTEGCDLGAIGSLWGTTPRKIGHGYWNGRAICYDDGTDRENLLADLDTLL